MIMFENRLKKNFAHLKKWAMRAQTNAYRVYDRDIPEFPFAIDFYDGSVVVYVYRRSEDQEMESLCESVAAVVSQVLQVREDDIVFKLRERKQGLSQYQKLGEDRKLKVVKEGGLSFEVNLSDYLDTGLFLDHRKTRALIRDLSKGKRVLNLFCYTGSASVYAWDGGAASVTSVDMSTTYLEWAKRNFALNGIDLGGHDFLKEDILQWLPRACAGNRLRFDLIFLDPPSFSNSNKMQSAFDVQRDHGFLVKRCLDLLEIQGKLLFSTNHRTFKMDDRLFEKTVVRDITQSTLPPDFRDKLVHKAWLLEKQ